MVKVLSLVAERQIETKEQKGLTEKEISQEEIRKSVIYLINTQNSDGSFSDSNPVIHREMQVLRYILNKICDLLNEATFQTLRNSMNSVPVELQ